MEHPENSLENNENNNDALLSNQNLFQDRWYALFLITNSLTIAISSDSQIVQQCNIVCFLFARPSNGGLPNTDVNGLKPDVSLENGESIQ